MASDTAGITEHVTREREGGEERARERKNETGDCHKAQRWIFKELDHEADSRRGKKRQTERSEFISCKIC